MIRARKSHKALPRPPKAFAICATVFSRRRGGITSVLRRFDGRSSASFCRNSTQYNLYIAKATDNISHSPRSSLGGETPTHSPPHATSSLSSVLLGADGQKSSDCEPTGKDRGAGADGATKYITTLRRNANIPIIIAVIVRTAIVAVITARQNRKIVRVRTHSLRPLNLSLPLFDTQQLNPHTHSRRRITLTRPPNIPLAGLTQWTQGHLTKGLESSLRRVKSKKLPLSLVRSSSECSGTLFRQVPHSNITQFLLVMYS